MGTSGGFDGDADWMYCLGKGEGPWRSEDESVSADEGGFGAGSFLWLLWGFVQSGLIAIPEFVYVRDIYENGNARANTMFKLTYQAYMLFGMTMGYGIFR